MVAKSKRHRNVRYCRRGGAELTLDANEEVGEEEVEEEEVEQDDDPRDSGSSYGKTSPQNDERDIGDDDVAVENIAERIKRRKVNAEKKTSKPEVLEPDTSSKRSTRKRVLSERRDKSTEDPAVVVSSSQEKLDSTSAPRSASKRRRMRGGGDVEKSESSTNSKIVGVTASKRSARTASSTKASSRAAASGESNGARYNNGKFNYDSPPESCDETEECVAEESNLVAGTCVNEKHERLSDDEVIEEQQRIEQVLLQEREDYELARRLQAKFDEMQQVARRTRRSSRRAVEDASFDVAELREVAAVRTVGRRASIRAPLVVRTAKTVPRKKRGRPPKRVK